MTYGLTKVGGIITAMSPVFHGGNEKTGSVVLLNRMKYLVENKFVDVPFVSGNEVRGYLRRLIFQDYLEKCEYVLDLNTKKGQSLFHTFFSGGILESVESSGSGKIDLSFKRKIYETILPARLFGFSFGNQMIEGKLKVSHMLPICRELSSFLPDGIKSDQSFYTFITRQFQTRRDELRQENEDKEKEENAQAVQMIIEQEVFVPGTQFYHDFVIEDPEPESLAVLSRMIELWKEKPFIGGKSSIGLGRLKLDYQFVPSSQPYLDFVEKNRAKIIEAIAKLEAIFE